MVSTSSTTGKGGIRRKRRPGPYKGVRMRKWGRWVSEIRVPKTKTRIWLGSYDSPEKAARAYDAALYCLRGTRGSFNFPADERPIIPKGSSLELSKVDIKEIAARFASPDFVSVPSLATTLTTLPDISVSSEMGSMFEVSESLVIPTSIPGPVAFSPEGLLSEDPILFDPDWIWNLL